MELQCRYGYQNMTVKGIRMHIKTDLVDFIAGLRQSNKITPPWMDLRTLNRCCFLFYEWRLSTPMLAIVYMARLVVRYCDIMNSFPRVGLLKAIMDSAASALGRVHNGLPSRKTQIKWAPHFLH